MSNRKLVAAIAVRNTGSRLYGKPLQNLNVSNSITIVDYLITQLKAEEVIDDVALAISEGVGNRSFIEVAERHNISYVIGDEYDVLGRLIQCGDKAGATDIFRITSESPFPYYEALVSSVREYYAQEYDALFLDDIIDGCGFEIINLDTLKKAHAQGEDKHRSELCTLYLRENASDFTIKRLIPPEELVRKDLRLTVDYPEDLIVCRQVYEELGNGFDKIKIVDIVQFLDQKPDLKQIIAPYTEAGYNLMYK
jgi:spore coat polysaccharide biosynthesis protein SpsF